MGKGDKKSKKGKRFMGSYGVSRPRKKGKLKFIPTIKKTKPAPVVAEKIAEEVVMPVDATTAETPKTKKKTPAKKVVKEKAAPKEKKKAVPKTKKATKKKTK